MFEVHLWCGGRRSPLALITVSLLLASTAFPATFTVSTTADSGAGSFRQAIIDANGSEGLDRIEFKISGTGVRTITLLSALPPLLDPAVIDGTTQTGYSGSPLVEINGAGAGLTPGLRLLAGNSTVRGLIINRFGFDGIRIDGPGTNTIQRCFLGTDPAGNVSRANGQEGILISGSWGNIIGGTNAGDANVIGGNTDAGVYILNGGGNVVLGNLIGVSAGATNALPNGNNGIIIYNSVGNLIGGADAASANLLSGNHGSGLYISGAGSKLNTVLGNKIGTTISGTKALSNQLDGITISGALSNTIGGATMAAGNVVSANGKAGIFLSAAAGNSLNGNLIGCDGSGKLALGNEYSGIILSGASNNFIGGNVISGNKQDGLLILTNSDWNLVDTNVIGLDLTAGAALPNAFNGVTINGSSYNRVGTPLSGARNIISGNGYYGVQLLNGSANNWLHGNFIGTDRAGARAVQNQHCGIRIEAPGNFVGGSDPASGNLISGNAVDGIYLVTPAASNNLVQKNLIGTTVTGNAPLGNQRAGVGLASGATANLILANVLSGNMDSGLFAVSNTTASNRIQGNRIGTDSTGSLAIPNRLSGIYFYSASSNYIGGRLPGEGNIISGSPTQGILLTNSSGNTIEGNLIGVAADGVTDLGNVFHGIELGSNCVGNVIGGTAPGVANTLAFSKNVYSGVRVRSGAFGNAILGNAIFSNGGLGIDLDSFMVTANDPCDADGGGNMQQNFPVLTSAVTGNGTGIRGELNSVSNRTYLLQFYANPACDPSGNGEGQIFLGQQIVQTGTNCRGTFAASFPMTLPEGFSVTATATDPDNNTSEFSACIAASPPPKLQVNAAPGGGMLLSWPAAPPGFVLKEAADLRPPISWSPVTNSATAAGGRFQVIIPQGPGNRYYQLFFE